MIFFKNTNSFYIYILSMYTFMLYHWYKFFVPFIYKCHIIAHIYIYILTLIHEYPYLLYYSCINTYLYTITFSQNINKKSLTLWTYNDVCQYVLLGTFDISEIFVFKRVGPYCLPIFCHWLWPLENATNVQISCYLVSHVTSKNHTRCFSTNVNIF